uniref:Sodium/potassium-transporting ATPase subunit beta n=1 Tax=Elaeophora elaphi TaxID=1147741 RepID=A0A0R3RG65_9BILA
MKDVLHVHEILLTTNITLRRSDECHFSHFHLLPRCMVRSSTKGAFGKDMPLKEDGKDKGVGSEKKWQKNSGDERDMQQQIPTSETKTEKRANGKEKTSSAAAISASSAAVDVSAWSTHDSHVEHEDNQEKTEKFMKSIIKFIYHDGYVCNRTISAWIVTISYLLCIYISLALLLTVAIYIMIGNTRDAPVYYGKTTFIGGVPGIGFEPRKRSMKKEQNVFKWNTNDPASYAFYVRRLRRILFEYAKMEMKQSKFKIDCKKTVVPHVGGKPVKHFCKTDVTNADENYDGLSLDTILVHSVLCYLFGYYPEQPIYDSFANSSLDFKTNKICSQVPNVTVCCNDDRMLFQCSLMNENTNTTIMQYPKFGYPYCFYPFNNQKGYMQPFVMIQMYNLIPNEKTGIKCVPTAPDLRERSLILWFEITTKRRN